ncbi:nickel pincer cofactor biosynthesis protein LarC [Bacillus sp. FJAT-27445]|uniref:nickel pincer cofactor biosynthesis protein LarC n=1 Tax=Bacillus sp. FJAT-27445 TaxID=1679166 RepID=UPI000743E5EC|nr:nickel pincer cofactor biosynthesis protein LarC [Bacillus sp. FJAT-27445]
MKILYLDCGYGISGDMTLSALIDLGADVDYIVAHLKKLPIDEFEMNVRQVNKNGISAKLLDLRFAHGNEVGHGHNKEHGNEHDSEHGLDHHGHKHSHNHEHEHSHNHEHEHSHNHEYGHSHNHEHKHSHSHEHEQNHKHEHNHNHEHELLHDHGHGHSHDHNHAHSHHHDEASSHGHFHRKASSILEMIQESTLPQRVKDRSTAVFQVIAEAEGKIHGMSPEDVHFHEVGAMDSIIDIIGVCLALESLGIDKVIAAPVPTGYGKIMIAHGLYPVPAPATSEILTDIPLSDFQAKGELTTPTGAGFLKALASEFGHLPGLPVRKIGYGAGKKNFAHPNVLRAFLFDAETSTQRETIVVLECQVDDMTGEMLGFTMDRLLANGALDVFFTPVTMKKSRPGVLLTVLAKPLDSEKIEGLLLRETSTFGVRKKEWMRSILQRRFQTVETPYGSLKVKIGFSGKEIYKAVPEYEEVRKVAIACGIGFMEVYRAAQTAAFMQANKIDN